MSTNGATDPLQPNFVGRIRSRQAGNPTGLLGRIIGRAMVKDTAASNDRCIELLELSGPRTVLEIGFGQGRTAAELVHEGHRVIGVDVSPTMVNQATARNRRACKDGRAELVLGDGHTVPFEDDTAGAALTAHTVYFMDERQKAMNEIARVLEPGGRFVMACRVGDDEMPAWMDPTIYRIPTIDQIQALLDGAGFEHVVHHPGDQSTHHTHWFVADLA